MLTPPHAQYGQRRRGDRLGVGAMVLDVPEEPQHARAVRVDRVALDLLGMAVAAQRRLSALPIQPQFPLELFGRLLDRVGA